jgi:hypothetical protein
MVNADEQVVGIKALTSRNPKDPQHGAIYSLQF